MAMRTASATAQTISAEQAAALVRSGDWIDYGVALCQPDVFDKALALRVDELRDVKFRSCLTMRPRAVLEADPGGGHFHWFSWHFSGYDRRKADAGISHYLPLNLGEVPDYYARYLKPVDVAVFKVRPMDAEGHFNFGPSNLWHRAVLERAKTVILEVNDSLPFAHGERNGVHASEVDYVIEGDGAAASELPNPPPTEADRAVGRLIAGEISDGDCLQIGIGGMPNAVCGELLSAGVKDLGIHTEMLTDGLVELYRAGRVTGARKGLYRGKVAYTFGLGMKPLYDTVERNADFHCVSVDSTNLPHLIMQNDNMMSINNTTQIDLQGQCASESDGLRHLTGTGGQSQFVRGAYASKGGKSFICLSSTYDKKGDRRSRIVLSLTPGNIVTAPRSDVMYIVTEFGMVNLKGKSIAERAMALISIAHPDFREGLERQAHEHRLIPKGVRF